MSLTICHKIIPESNFSKLSSDCKMRRNSGGFEQSINTHDSQRRNSCTSSHGTLSAPSQQNEDLVNIPKRRNNKFKQTRLAGSLMQPLSIRKIDRSASGGPNLSQSEHAIRTQNHTLSMMHRPNRSILRGEAADECKEQHHEEQSGKEQPVNEQYCKEKYAREQHAHVPIHATSMVRSPSGSILRVKTADESRRLHSHNSAGPMRLRQSQSSTQFNNTIPTEQHASSNATWGDQPMQNTIIRRISDPAASTSKEQHGEEQYVNEQYFREQPVKEKIVRKQSVKEQKITNGSSRVSSSGYKGDVDSNSKTNSSWDNIANERPPSPSEKITNGSSRFSSSGYKGDVGNKSKTNNSWDNIANEHPPSLSEKITNESSRVSSSGYKGDVGNNSKTNSSRDNIAPVEEQHIKQEYGKEQPFKEQSVKKQPVKEKPVKDHYGKERHAREKYVHVQKQTPSMARAPSISRVETTDESRRLHPHNSAGSLQLRQSQSSILSGNTIPTEQNASSNTTWGNQPLQNTIKRRISEPAALTSNETSMVRSPSGSILRVKTADESRRLHPHNSAGSMRLRQSQSSIQFNNTIPTEQNASSNATWGDQPMQHTIDEQYVTEKHVHVPMHASSMVRSPSGSILRVKTADESRRLHSNNSAGSMRLRQSQSSIQFNNTESGEHYSGSNASWGDQHRYSSPQKSHMVTIDSMKSLGSKASFHSAKSFDSKTSFGSSDRLTRTKGSLVNFNKITIVEYDRRIGDHPGARGPPISMGRYPKGETDMSLEQYENTMKKNRSRTELFLTPVQREAELRRAGYSRGEIFEATQGVKDIQRMRKQTAKHLKERDAKVSAAKKFGLDFH